MSYQLITAPSGEPVTLAEAKLHLRVDYADDDALITSLITAARQYAEMATQRQFMTAQWRLALDCFPKMIRLDKTPLVTVDSIKYTDLNGVLQTMPITDYVVDISAEPARITPVFGKIWPIPVPQIDSVQVNFTCGYGVAAAVPEGIKSWIKMRIASLYEHREEVALIQRGKIEPLPFVDGLLDPFRVMAF